MILGGNLTEDDAATWGLFTKPAVIALNQQDRVSHPLVLGEARVWTSAPRGKPVDTIAVFNLSDKPLAVDQAWSDLGAPRGTHAARNLWTGAGVKPGLRAQLSVAPHDVALLRLAR